MLLCRFRYAQFSNFNMTFVEHFMNNYRFSMQIFELRLKFPYVAKIN